MISIIVPTLNEERNIERVIDNLKKFTFLDCQIMIIDGGSQDRTVSIVKDKGIQVYQLDAKGKGRAMRLGADKAKGEILVFIDGDDSYSPQNIHDLIKPILKEEIDIVYGSRFLPSSKRKMSFIRYVGNKLFSFSGSLLYRKTTDLLTGFFAIKRKKFLEPSLESNGFEIETEIFTKAAINKLKIKEVPIKYTKNEGSKLNPLRDGLKILAVLFKNYVKT